MRAVKPSMELTRTASVPHLPSRRFRALLLRAGDVVQSPETRFSYRIERLVGEGGFGQVFLATTIGWAAHVPETVCIKASAHIDGWLREAYFGQLLKNHPRAIGVFDVFPLMRPGDGVIYCLALEYAAPWRPRRVSVSGRETVDGAGDPPRDRAACWRCSASFTAARRCIAILTPMNVFVCEKWRLKLGDFGIARQQSDHRGVTARTMNSSDGAERYPGARGPEMAGARRCVSDRPAARNADQGRCAIADTNAGCPHD